MMMNLPDLSKFKALYLEDEALIAMDGEEILRAMGINDVYVAYTISDAQGAAEKGKFDLALLDVNLGDGQSSLKFAEHLIGQGTLVIFASGYNPSEGLVSQFDVPLVVKPFDEPAIRAALQDAFARRQK